MKGLSTGWGTYFCTVQLDQNILALACWKDTIAVGLESNHIITLNAITGSKTAVLSGHTGTVLSLASSPDGTSLVSGSSDKLWDMQTGGVVKTFEGHTGCVLSISISGDCTNIVSESDNKIICLWYIQSGSCYFAGQQENKVHCVCLFPLDPQCYIYISGDKIQEWNINSHWGMAKYDGSCATFSCDGTKLILHNKAVVQVQSSDSRAVVAEFCVDNINTNYCCFSPDGRLVAAVAVHIAYVWDIMNPEPCLIETFVGHTSDITSLVFSSPTSLISISQDQSIKFWQISTPSTSLDITDLESISHISPIKSITLQAKDEIAISSDSDGVVRIWGLSTDICKALFQTPAKGSCLRDVQLIGSKLVLVWYMAKKIHIWDVEKGKPL